MMVNEIYLVCIYLPEVFILMIDNAITPSCRLDDT